MIVATSKARNSSSCRKSNHVDPNAAIVSAILIALKNSRKKIAIAAPLVLYRRFFSNVAKINAIKIEISIMPAHSSLIPIAPCDMLICGVFLSSESVEFTPRVVSIIWLECAAIWFGIVVAESIRNRIVAIIANSAMKSKMGRYGSIFKVFFILLILLIIC